MSLFKNIDKSTSRPIELQKKLFVYSMLLTSLLSGLYFSGSRIIQALNLKTTDIIIRAAKVPESKIDVVIAAIDEASLQRYGQWPWPRTLIAELLQAIQNAGAKSIGVDILFPEQDRTSEQLFKGNSSSDHHLAESLNDGPFVLGYQFVFNEDQASSTPCELHPLSLLHNQKNRTPAPPLVFHKASGVICSNKLLSAATDLSGFFNGTPDPDGIIRRLPLLIEYQDTLYPSFALTVFLQHQNKQSHIFRANNGHIPNLSSTNLHLPIDNRGHILLGPARTDKKDHISAVQILEQNRTLESLRNKVVLVGLTAAGLTQVYQTPFSPVTSLLELHQHVIETLGADQHTTRGPFFPVYETLTSLFLTVLLVAGVSYLPVILAIPACLLTTVVIFFTAVLVYQSTGYLFSPLLPVTAVFSNCILLHLYRFRYLQILATSESKETLLLLESSETNLRSVLNTIPDIVFRLDENARLTFISPAISKYHDLPDQLLGRPIFDLVASEDIDKVKYKLNERRTGKRATFDLEVRLLLRRLDSSSPNVNRYFNFSAEGIYQNDDPSQETFIGTQGIVRDITKRKRLEEQLLQAQKMEVIGNLASGIAHDLNNILSGLVSYPDMLLLDIPQDDPMYSKISVIQRSGKKAAVIVQDLLTLARRNVIINQVCNINSILSDYLDSVEFRHLETRYPEVTIRANLDQSLTNIKGSAAHLSKVVMNILHNALEAMPAGGYIAISTRNIQLNQHLNGYERIPEGLYSLLSIADQGVGISEIDLKRIFEPFYTKKSMTGNSTGGTGLGMTVIWATIKDHGGYIDIQSSEGNGTTVHLYLPATGMTTDSVPRLVTLDEYIGSETILVVDDMPEQLTIARSMLNKLGYTVLTVACGEDAIGIIQEESVDLVILDMIMPGGFDGIRTYQEIIKINPTQKAIIASGYSESEQVRDLKQLGVCNYIQKPYSMETLGTSVRRELDAPSPT